MPMRWQVGDRGLVEPVPVAAGSTASVSAPSAGARPSSVTSPSNWAGAGTSTTLPVAVVLDQLGVLVGQHLLVVAHPAGRQEHVPLAVLLGQVSSHSARVRSANSSSSSATHASELTRRSSIVVNRSSAIHSSRSTGRQNSGQ